MIARSSACLLQSCPIPIRPGHGPTFGLVIHGRDYSWTLEPALSMRTCMRNMATPTEVDRCERLEQQDAALTSLKLGISSYSGAQSTLVSLRKSSHLRDLFITSSIGDSDVGRLCREVLLRNTSLEHLTLDLRECSDRGAQYLAELIQYSRNIRWLSLMLNNITEKGAQRLAEALGKSTLLGFAIYATQLDLYDCSIGDIVALDTLQVLSKSVGLSLQSA